MTELWAEGQIDQEEKEDQFTELMLNLALERCGEKIEDQDPKEKVISLKDVGLYNRSSTFPPLFVVSGVARLVRAVTNDIRKLRWHRSPEDNLSQELQCYNSARTWTW